MILMGRCFERNCVHFQGVRKPDGNETSEKIVCGAYPDGIPLDIAEGQDLHMEVRPDQDNDITYEEE